MTKALPIALLLLAPLGQPALAIEESQKNALAVVTGMYGAADALCKNYLVNLEKVAEVLVMLDVTLDTPKGKALYLQGYANFEKQVRSQGENVACNDIYHRANKSVPPSGTLLITTR